MTASYNPSHFGVGEMLRADFMQDAMRVVADEIKARAIALAPVGEEAHDDHAGRYKSSFHTRSHISYTAPGRYGGGRAEAVVYNNAPEALYVEYGHFGREPYRVLGRAAFARLRR